MQSDSVTVHVYISVTFLWQHIIECNTQRLLSQFLFFLLFAVLPKRFTYVWLKSYFLTCILWKLFIVEQHNVVYRNRVYEQERHQCHGLRFMYLCHKISEINLSWVYGKQISSTSCDSLIRCWCPSTYMHGTETCINIISTTVTFF